MTLKTKKYDVANYLDSAEMITVYLNAAFESGEGITFSIYRAR